MEDGLRIVIVDSAWDLGGKRQLSSQADMFDAFPDGFLVTETHPIQARVGCFVHDGRGDQFGRCRFHERLVQVAGPV